MKGFAATITAKELARALASHRAPESNRNAEATPRERFPESSAGNTDAPATTENMNAAAADQHDQGRC